MRTGLFLGVALLSGCGGMGMTGADAGRDRDARIGPMPDAGPGEDSGTPPDLDGGTPPTECPLASACDDAPPALGATGDWNHLSSEITAGNPLNSPRHRGRDLFLTEGQAQWALAKLAYGTVVVDDGIEDEDVDIYLQENCTGDWQSLGTFRTTDDGTNHPEVYGVPDGGARIFLDLSTVGVTLGLGRHRILFVVVGDHTMANQIIEVLPSDARFVVTDVDGTQTSSETAAWGSLLTGSPPTAQPYGAAALAEFAHRGFHVFYLTARPEWLDLTTHEWLADNGYPPGIVHTTLTFTGALGSSAQDFKTAELAALQTSFPGAPTYAIGNTDTDEGAYAAVSVDPSQSYLYQFDPVNAGDATRVDDYSTLIPIADGEAVICR